MSNAIPGKANGPYQRFSQRAWTIIHQNYQSGLCEILRLNPIVKAFPWSMNLGCKAWVCDCVCPGVMICGILEERITVDRRGPKHEAWGSRRVLGCFTLGCLCAPASYAAANHLLSLLLLSSF